MKIICIGTVGLLLATGLTQAAGKKIKHAAYPETPDLAEVLTRAKERWKKKPGYPAHGSTLDLVRKAQSSGLPKFPKTQPHDKFALRREFDWKPPQGDWMNQLLKDIDAAKAAGDSEAYNALQARYSAWAEKYLRRDDPPNLDNHRDR